MNLKKNTGVKLKYLERFFALLITIFWITILALNTSEAIIFAEK